jgi:hypothetical protein
MKLRPLQIVGLFAVVVFGGYLIYTLTAPKPDPFVVPGAASLSEPAAPIIAAEAPAPAPAPEDELPAIDRPLEVGSQEARDDLYCSGLLFAANPAPMEALTPVEEGRIFKARMQAMALAQAGVEHLLNEKVAHVTQTGRIADAWAEAAADDIQTGDHKISLEECTQRAEALPPAQ